MIFKSGAGVAPRESTAATTAGFRRALRMGTILGAGALIMAPGASLADFIYTGPASTGSATTTAITPTVTGSETILIITTTGGTVTVSSGPAISTIAVAGAAQVTLGASVSGVTRGVNSTSVDGNITIRSASGAAITATATGSPANIGIFASTTGNGVIDIGSTAGLGGAVSGDVGIEARSAGAGGINIKTASGGTVMGRDTGILTTSITAATVIDLGAIVTGAVDGVKATATGNGTITIKSGSAANITGTAGYGVHAASDGGYIDLGGTSGLGGAISGVTGIYAATTGSAGINVKTAGNVTSTGDDGIATSAVTGETKIAIESTSTITGGARAISVATGTGDVTVTSLGSVKNSIAGTTGGGSLTFNNAGTLTLVGAQANNGFTINNRTGGILTGTGSFGVVNAEEGSIIRPGDRSLAIPLSGVPVMGNMRTGDLTLAAGAIVEARADYSGVSDSISVTGDATLGGATLKILATPNDERTWMAGPKSFVVMNVSGTITGTFGSVTTEYAFLNATAAYSANSVTATLERNAVTFADVAVTKLQTAVGAALDRYSSQSTNPLIQKTTLLTRLEAPAALQQLAGAGLNSTHSLAFGASRLVIDTVSAEMGRFTGSAGGGTALSYIEDTRIKTPAFKQVAPKVEPIADGRVWAQFMGGIGAIKANEGSGAPSERASTYGIAAGIDRAYNPNLRLGFALAGGQSTLKVSDLATKSDATWGQAALYAVATNGSLYAKTSLSMGYVSNETERTVTAFGTPEKATGEFSSLLYAARVEIGQRFEIAPAGVTPFLAFEPALVAHNAYNENAATPIALGFGKSTANALPGTLGVKIDATVDLGDVRLTPSAALAWVHNFANATTISPFFTALPGSTFSVTGVEGDRDLARTELTLEATRVGSLASVFANARADLGQRTNSLRGTGGMMVRF
jgi:uncharacterized protein with beta-barrel porin domain